jgi:hypothetical protein
VARMECAAPFSPLVIQSRERLLPVTGLESAGFDRCAISSFANRAFWYRAGHDKEWLTSILGGTPNRIRCRRSSWPSVRSKDMSRLAVYEHWNVHDVHDRHNC